MISNYLPGATADKLLTHLSTCPQCRRAAARKRRGKICPTGRALIRLTLTERHGDDER